MSTKTNKLKKVLFLINPTPYEDYDIICIGYLPFLKVIKKEYRGDLVNSKFGCPILVIDTFDVLEDANNSIKELKLNHVKYC